MFIDNKYTKTYFRLVQRAKELNRVKVINDGCEVHHIIPRSLGGGNSIENLVTLTYKEHRVCHRLLISMTEGQYKYKMMYAYKFFNKAYDTSGVPQWGNRGPEVYRRGVLTRKQRNNYKMGKDNNFCKPEIIEIVRKRIKEDNPMKDSKQGQRQPPFESQPPTLQRL